MSPAARARSTSRCANSRWSGGYGSPSWVHRSTGAQAQPGAAASTVSAPRSGCRRRSPTGPPIRSPVVMESSTQNTSCTLDMPTPQAAACSRRPVGTAFTRVTPVLSTQVSATPWTPAAASSAAAARAAAARASRSSTGSHMPGILPVRPDVRD
ncbi:hypothetical protein ACFQY4_10875 [Catellatospora bangladeshensis]|uniref:hypothetical protein n=1 Tax=Catellatospora bangladeshensis TaxID=310355 RepID=UPI00362079C0